MFRQSRFIAIVALAVSALAVSTRPALAEADGASVRQSVANATLTTAPNFLVKGITSNAAAQDQQSANGRNRSEGFGFGAEFGPIFSNFDGADQDLKSNAGFEGGIFFGGNRGGTVGVMGKLLYAVKGASNDFDDSVKIHYLEIPVLVRINIGSNSRNGVSVYGLVGPVFDIKLKAAFNGESVSDQYQGLDLGLQFGGGVEITRFLVEGVYTKGLRAVNNGDFGDIEEIKTHSFAILFGFRFN